MHIQAEFIVKESRPPTEKERKEMPGVKRIITKAEWVSSSVVPANVASDTIEKAT